MDEQKHCVVLAPTHRSLMDYILAKYIAFSMVGLGIDVPIVYAQPEFDDPTTGNISARIGRRKSRFDRHATFAAFLEGSPSPDGRFQKPRTQFLSDLVKSPGSHNYTLIPVSIDYDRVDNNNTVLKEATRRSANLGLWAMIKLYWQVRSCGRQEPSFGDVRISFGVPTSLEASSDFDVVANHCQAEQRRLTTISEYQIAAAESHLNVPASALRNAMEHLGTRVCNNKTERKSKKTGKFMDIAVNNDDMWRLHLQWLPRLAPYLADSHPAWAQWIMGGASSVPLPPKEIAKTPEMDAVLKAVCAKLEAAEILAQLGEQVLREGEASEVSLESLINEMRAKDADCVASSPSICRAAASFVLKKA